MHGHRSRPHGHMHCAPLTRAHIHAPCTNNHDRHLRSKMQRASGTVDGIPKAAIRVGKYKLITGQTAVFAPAGAVGGPYYASNVCVARDNHPEPSTMSIPYTITNATSPPFCVNGWVPPPESGGMPILPPGVQCLAPTASSAAAVAPSVPCVFDSNNSYCNGQGIFLFDIETDPTEHFDLAAKYPEVVRQLMDRLDVFVNQSIYQENGAVDPASNPKYFNNVWTPWVGNPDPAACAAPPKPPVPPCNGEGNIVGSSGPLAVSSGGGSSGAQCVQTGWCSGNGFTGPAKTARVVVDGTSVAATGVANVERKVAGHVMSTPSAHCHPPQHPCTVVGSYHTLPNLM